MANIRFQDLLDTIVTQSAGLPEPQVLATWTPPLCGDIDIRILANGSWLHEGAPIRRGELVRMFASLLRREDDGHYYLLTPAEKWRITVERHPLLAVDCQHTAAGRESYWQVLLNTGGCCRIGGEYRLHSAAGNGEPFVDLPNGLTAQISRAAWYRLLDSAIIENNRAFIISGGEEVYLGATA